MSTPSYSISFDNFFISPVQNKDLLKEHSKSVKHKIKDNKKQKYND